MKEEATSNLFAVPAVVLTVLVMVVACQAPAPPPPDWSAQNGPLIETYISVWNSANFDELDAVMATGFVRTEPGVSGGANNLDEMKEMMASFRSAWPDTQVTLDEAHYMENVGVLLWTFSGTNTGEGATPPTGKPAEISGISFFRFADGKITEEHVRYDTASMYGQLGFTLVPPGAESG
ncbi:MAG: ester cyclase [Acidobacteriota bacterium]|nr:ester cyclase [Acidobacteriota bacterium]